MIKSSQVFNFLSIILGFLCGVPIHAQAASFDQQTCFITGGGTLQVCHNTSAEGVYYQPDSMQIGYNTQIMSLGAGKYATILHSEAEDTQALGHIRPGDSIKSGVAFTALDPHLAYKAPPDLTYRIWGSLTNPASPLYYGIHPEDPAARGISGGGNPMVVGGQPGDPFYYVFYLGVMSDQGRGEEWRNVLLEARTLDFYKFDLLQQNREGDSVWVPFAGNDALPVVIEDVSGRPIVSNQPASANHPTSNARRKHVGISTAGLFGSIVLIKGVYYYFYTDEDATNPGLNHLYVRTAMDLTGDRKWSEPTIVMDVPPQIMIRVAKARGMDRWAVYYMCLRSVEPFISDLCLQYTSTMNIIGEGGISSLALFDGPSYTGKSSYALGMVGANPDFNSGAFLKIQPYYLTDRDGSLAVSPNQQGNVAMGGMATWNDLPSNYNIFGAPTYWGEWTVTPVNQNSGSAAP